MAKKWPSIWRQNGDENGDKMAIKWRKNGNQNG